MKPVKRVASDSQVAQPPKGGGAPANRGQQQEAGGMDLAEAEARHAFARTQAGETAAYGTVVRLYQDRIFSAVYRMVHHVDDAAEITQEAFMRGLEKIDSFRGDAGPYTWLFRIAMNAAVSRIRKGSRRRTTSLDTPSVSWQTSLPGLSVADEGPSPEELASLTEDQRAVAVALSKMDAEYRAILVMRDMEGFDYKQMADVLGMPMGTVKSRLFRARVAMRELLQDHFAARYRNSTKEGGPDK